MVKKEEAQNCWDFLGCDFEVREKCPAYKSNSGRECWYLAVDTCPFSNQEFKTCFECTWYQKMNHEELKQYK